MKKIGYLFSLMAAVALAFPHSESYACTSAIISADVNPTGRPLLWKHRDTSTTDNKVAYIPAKNGMHAYTALFNSKDMDFKQAWIGMNDVGFAIMNTASSNLKDDNVPKSKMNREGYVMAKALQTCKSVDDFEELLKSLPKPLGVEANFGVIDATGNGAYFETNNHSFTRYNLSDAENGVLVRTNYSHSGRKGEGGGYVREADANHMLAPYIQTRSVTPEVLTEELSRTFYHAGKDVDYSLSETTIRDEGEFIPRFTSTSSVVIEGCKPVKDIESVTPGVQSEEYIMWTAMGYPPCADVYAVRCNPDGVPTDLIGNSANGHCPAGDRVKARKNEVFSFKKGDKKGYVNLKKLYNQEGTGYVQTLTQKNLETYKRERGK